MKFQDRMIENETIFISDKEVNVLGPRLILKNCQIKTDCSEKTLVFVKTEIIGGVFHAQKELANFQWDDNKLIDIKFLGDYSSCDFGDWDSLNCIQDCDFQEATLNGCRFINCDVSKLSFPKWPSFIIENPYTKEEIITNIQWPGDWDIAMEATYDNEEECKAIAFHLDKMIAEYGGHKQELKNKISQIATIN